MFVDELPPVSAELFSQLVIGRVAEGLLAGVFGIVRTISGVGTVESFDAYDGTIF